MELASSRRCCCSPQGMTLLAVSGHCVDAEKQPHHHQDAQSGHPDLQCGQVCGRTPDKNRVIVAHRWMLMQEEGPRIAAAPTNRSSRSSLPEKPRAPGIFRWAATSARPTRNLKNVISSISATHPPAAPPRRPRFPACSRFDPVRLFPRGRTGAGERPRRPQARRQRCDLVGKQHRRQGLWPCRITPANFSAENDPRFCFKTNAATRSWSRRLAHGSMLCKATPPSCCTSSAATDRPITRATPRKNGCSSPIAGPPNSPIAPARKSSTPMTTPSSPPTACWPRSSIFSRHAPIALPRR
jgi:hypothetical protein